jgi:hypothetical protein
MSGVVVAHTYNQALGKLRQKDHKIQDSLDYKVKFYLK